MTRHVWPFVWLAWLGAARGPNEDMDTISGNAKAAAADARSVAAESNTRMDVMSALRQMKQTKASMRGAASLKYIQRAADEVQVQDGEAEQALKNAQDGAKSAELIAGRLGAETKTLADGLVKQELGDLANQVVDWKFNLLHAPANEARKAAVEASKPYEAAMMALEKRVGEYQQKAMGISDLSFNLQRTAAGLATGAVLKQRYGYGEAAVKDMTNSHHMMAQAIHKNAEAIKLNQAAMAMQLNIPLYQQAAQMKFLAAMHRLDPNSNPPIPQSPSGYSLPPPPADNPPLIDVLQLKQTSLEEP